MLKTLRSALIICLAAVFGTFIVLEALGFKGQSQQEEIAAAPSDTAEQFDSASVLDREELTASYDVIAEPGAQETVTVLVGLEGAPLLSTANERGQTVMELYGGFDGRKLSEARQAEIDGAISALSPLLLEVGYRYTAVFNGFSAKIRYGDLARIEGTEGVKCVILSDTYEAPQAITENDVNVQDTGIFDSTDVGYDGTGTVVAVLDTGTDYTHEVFDMALDPDTMALTKDDVAAAVASGALAATSMSMTLINPVEVDEDDLYLSSKLPYAFDYADIDANVYPAEAHGTHVAGIIAGESQRIRGVAPRAQIATFKVFEDSGMSSTEGILAALNDAAVLGVDAINMSLGASCGFTREEDEENVNETYDLVRDSGISLVVAAGNEYSSSYGGAHGNTNLATNPDAGTVGSPASYEASLAVASISGVKTPYVLANGEKEIYFNESRTTGKTKPNNFVNELLGEKESGTYDYVVIPGIGNSANYTGIDVEGKIAVVKRGSTSFEDKVKVAQSKGAIAVIVYNNLSGMLNMSIGTVYRLPSCLISMDFGKYLETIPEGKIELRKDYLAGPFMSDFSSWGPLPNLELCPDITGHGGDITSSYPGGNEYDTISGTSMACPNIAGAVVLVREYVKNMPGIRTTEEVRDLTYNLMMSTATIARNEEGNPYSPRKQGAGIGDIKRSVSTKAYLSVTGSNKAKLSLGDDPSRGGVYEMKFNITNLTGDAVSYKINPIVMTESMSSDEKTVAEKAYMLNPSATYSIKASTGKAVIEHGTTVSLDGYAQAELTVTVKLSAADKDYLNRNFANGMYVEGYIELQSYNEDKINLNIPFLAFYGNWTDAPMLDVTAYEVGESAVDSSVLAEDKLVADVYGTLPMAGFNTTDDDGEDQIASWGLGAYGYNLPQGYTAPVTRERYASLTHNVDGNYLLYTIAAGLFRNAKRVDMEIRDSVTGELVWAKTDYNARKSHSSGGDQVGGYVMVDFDVRNYDLANNGKYTFNMACYLDWGDGETLYGNRNTFSFEFYIDDEKPVLLKKANGDYAVYVRDENDRKTVELNVYDNHYLQGYLIYTYEDIDANGEPVGLTPITPSVIPVYDGKFNDTTRLSFDVTPYWSEIVKNDYRLYVQVMDYAKNNNYFFVTLSECDDVQLAKTHSAREEYTVRPNGELDLNQYLTISSKVEDKYSEGYWTKDLIWTSSEPTVATVEDGLVVALQAGTATISVEPDGIDNGFPPVTFTIKVDGDPRPKIEVNKVELDNYALSLERGEKAVITATVKPSKYLDDIKLVWSSSSVNVTVTPDEDDQYTATVTAVRSGSASVSVRVDGTYVNAACSVYVEEEYYVDSVYLRSYTGRGDENGVVEIPDDLGISYIYPMAFFDNPYITKIIIPEGVINIMRAGIYGCDNLEEIVLPESCTDIQTFGVAWNPKLTKINTEKVQTIGSRAFINDSALEQIDLRRTTYISDMAFAFCTGLKSIDLSKVGTVGEYAFYGCTGLSDLVLPANTTTSLASFYGCTGLRHVLSYSSNVGIGAFAECSSLIDVTFAGDVELIGEQAFFGCTALQSVNFLGTVYEIGAQAFANDFRITSFTLPAGLTKIGQQAFINCLTLSTVYVDKDACIPADEFAPFYGLLYVQEYVVEEGNKYLSSENGVLYDRAKYRLVAYPYAASASSFRVPDTVRVIGASAFFGVDSLSTVDLNNVEVVDEYAFSECTANITGGKLARIGAYAFSFIFDTDTSEGGSGLTALPITDGVTTYIGDYAFAGCDGFTNTALTIPDSVTYLGEGAFYNTSLTSITFGTGLKQVGEGAFANCDDLASIAFGSLEEIAPGMFYGCLSLESVNVPDTVKKINRQAFYACTELKEVTLPDGLTEIPAQCFASTAITSIKLPSALKSIGDRAFMRVNFVGTVSLPDSLERIGDGAFEESSIGAVSSPYIKWVGARAFYNSNVTNVSIPAAESIGSEAFLGCTQLTAADVSSAKTIGARAFAGCTQLATVTVSKAEEIGEAAFRGDSELKALTLSAVKTIGANAFNGTKIATLNLPNLQSVAQQAFAGTASLTAITVQENNIRFTTDERGALYRKNSGNFFTLVAYPLGRMETEYTVMKRTVKVGAYAFAENSHLTKIVLPEHLKAIGVGAFYGATALAEVEFGAVAAPTLESIGAMENDELINTYNNFRTEFDPDGGEKITLKWIVPKNATGYDSYIWREYLGQDNIEYTEEDGINASALDFIDRVNALSSLAGDERAAEITLLLRIFNMLDRTQQAFIRGGYAEDGTDYYAKLQAASGTSYAEPAEVATLPAAETPAAQGSFLWIAWLALAVVCGAAVLLIIRRERRGK